MRGKRDQKVCVYIPKQNPERGKSIQPQTPLSAVYPREFLHFPEITITTPPTHPGLPLLFLLCTLLESCAGHMTAGENLPISYPVGVICT